MRELHMIGKIHIYRSYRGARSQRCYKKRVVSLHSFECFTNDRQLIRLLHFRKEYPSLKKLKAELFNNALVSVININADRVEYYRPKQHTTFNIVTQLDSLHTGTTKIVT